MDADFYEQQNPRFLTEAEITEQQETHKPVTDDPFPNVPSELKALPQWVVWAYVRRDGKLTKIPKQITGDNAKSNDASTWTDYETACQALQKDRFTAHRTTGRPFQGIGFVFSPNDPYTGIDLDNCIVDGKVREWAKEILVKLKGVAYCEVSPSKNGIKVWTRAKLPAIAKHKVYIDSATGEAIEAYDNTRYFTVTGRGKYAIGDGQDAIDWLVAKHLSEQVSTQPMKPPVNDSRDTRQIQELIDNSRQRAKYHALMAGKWEGQGYGSHSEADIGFISLLCFWTQDTRHLDAIFRQSALYRPKWDVKHRGDGATYGEMTIEKALSQSRETYTPRKANPKRKHRDTFYKARAKRRRYGNQR